MTCFNLKTLPAVFFELATWAINANAPRIRSIFVVRFKACTVQMEIIKKILKWLKLNLIRQMTVKTPYYQMRL